MMGGGSKEGGKVGKFHLTYHKEETKGDWSDRWTTRDYCIEAVDGNGGLMGRGGPKSQEPRATGREN